MPKLDKKQAAAVDQAEAAGSFLQPNGRYAARLKSVEEKPGTEAPYWAVRWEAIHDIDGKQLPGMQFRNLSLSEKAAPFMKAFFEAHGYTADTDTDEMIRDKAWVVLTLGQELQAKGKGIGKLRNTVDNMSPFDPADWPFDPDSVVVKETKADAEEGGAGDDF